MAPGSINLGPSCSGRIKQGGERKTKNKPRSGKKKLYLWFSIVCILMWVAAAVYIIMATLKDMFAKYFHTSIYGILCMYKIAILKTY